MGKGAFGMFKKAGIFCIAFLLILSLSTAGAGGLFPTANEMFGLAMPSIAVLLGRPADETGETEEALTETYLHFGTDEYIAFGEYLAGIGAEILEYEVLPTEIRTLLSARGAQMPFIYNWEKQTATAVYPEGTRPETEKASTKSESCLLPPVGGILPSAEFAIGRKPDEEKKEDGSTIQIYSAFTDENYSAFSRYLSQNAATIQKKKNKSGTLTAVIQMNGAAFTLVYDWNDQTATCVYPEGTRPESYPWRMSEKDGDLLPEIESIGEELPNLYMAIQREPTRVRKTPEGGLKEVYSDFYDRDYDAFSEYLAAKNCTVDSFQTENDSVLNIRLSNTSGSMTFSYDALNHRATVVYPAHTRAEKTWTMTIAEGDYVSFGRYEQDGDSSNGPEEIEWLVLEVKDTQVLLISRYGLDARKYNSEHKNVTWEECTLRSWLNGTFLNNAFTETEQAEILLTNVDNSKSQGYSGWSADGGNNTQDKVFLLSCAEANRYLDLTYENSNNMKSRVAPTAYAIYQGAYTSNSAQTEDGAAAGWWWLRSPGRSQWSAAFVSTDGFLNYNNVDNDNGCVRPALWINLESDIF